MELAAWLEGRGVTITRSILSIRYSMKQSQRTSKESIVPRARIFSYRFSAFTRAIDDLPVSQIKPTAEDYHECIAWDLARGNIILNRDVQNILAFWRFLHSNMLPQGLSRFEQRFYLRTVGRMISHALLPTNVLDQFKSRSSKKPVETKKSSSLRGRRNRTNRSAVQTTRPPARKLRR